MQSPVVTIEPNIQRIIDKLISCYQSDEYEAQYNKLSHSLPTQKKFLIKQELARLFKPSIKTIDLSGKTDYPVKEFKWQNKRFYLDEIAKRIFLQAIDQFGGEYTEGVYDTVTSDSIYQDYEKHYQEEERLASYKVNLTELGRTTKRLEERLYCAKPVKIETAQNQTLSAITSNISRSGCLIRIEDIANLKVDDLIKISFTSLTEQFKFNKNPVCEYQIKFIASEPDKDNLYKVGVQLHESNHEWMQFLDKYVLANRASFKVDISNAKELTESRLLENHLLKTSLWLPVFIQLKNQQVKQVRYVLTNEYNAHSLSFFDDLEQNNRLNSIIFKVWPSLAQAKYDNPLLLVARLKNHNKSQFIAADLAELIESQRLDTFISFARLKGELKLFQVRTKALTDNLIDQFKLNWFKSSKEADRALEPLTLTNHLIYLHPLDQALAWLLEKPQSKLAKSELATLNQYICPKIKNQSVANFDVTAKCSRAEHRYFLNSNIVFSDQRQAYKAQLLDLSVRGLSIRVEAIPKNIELNQVVTLKVGKLAQFNKIVDDTSAQYKIVGINDYKHTLHLQLIETSEDRPLEKYMRALIKQHRSKLKINDQYDKFVILQKALCIAFISLYPGCAFGITRSKKNLFDVSRILSADRNNSELALLKQLQQTLNAKEMTLYPILKGIGEDAYLTELVDFTRQKQFNQAQLIFPINKHQQLEQKVNVQLLSFESLNDTLSGQFSDKKIVAIQLKMYPVVDHDIEIISDNLNYIARYNRHQAEQLKQFAGRLFGMIEMLDISLFWQLVTRK